MNAQLPGVLNGPIVGIVMKEMARRAMESIAKNRVDFVATAKSVDYKEGHDFLTNADTEAQNIYMRTLSEAFPTYGVIAEENDLRVGCSEDCDIYFTVDPLDGTKAFMRRQSHGIGTMISLVCNKEVIAACVGDVMTKEIYYFRPDSKKVHRFNWNDEVGETLSVRTGELSREYVLLGDDPRIMSDEVKDITLPHRVKPVFRNIEITGGSIGIKFARLWKGEVGAIILKAGKYTPWDWCPVAGISAKLGFIQVSLCDNGWMPALLGPIKEVAVFERDTVILHGSRFEEFVVHAQ